MPKYSGFASILTICHAWSHLSTFPVSARRLEACAREFSGDTPLPDFVHVVQAGVVGSSLTS